MIITIKEEHKNIFLQSIVDYINEYYLILPRNFDYTSCNYDLSEPKIFDFSKNNLINNALTPCPHFRQDGLTHIHCHETPFEYCTQPEIFAALFINFFVTEPTSIRFDLFKNLKTWLPLISWQYTTIYMTPEDKK